MKYCYDTNALILHSHLLDIEGIKIIPLVVLRELDKLKVGLGEIAYNAREAIRKLKANQTVFYDLDFDQNNLINNDDVIIKCAKKHSAILISGDYVAQIKAKAQGINVYETDKVENYYKGYIDIAIDDEEMAYLYSNMELNTYNLFPNQYLIIKNKKQEIVDKLRWDGNKLVKLKLPNIKGLKGKHHLQECAIDLLFNSNITTKIILGTYGSGKTYLSTKVALHHVLDKGTYSKILVVREPIGEGKEIGFLKGTKDDKTADFFKPIEQSLDGSFFQIEALERNGTLEKEIPYFLKGTTYNDTIILVDEAEDLTYKQLRLVGTRVGEKSNIIFAGDYKQAVHDTSVNNGLLQLVNKLKGNPMFGVIDLIEDVRSETSKMFAELD